MYNPLDLHVEIDGNGNELNLINGGIYSFKKNGENLLGMYSSNNHAFWMNGNYLSCVSFCDDVKEFNNS